MWLEVFSRLQRPHRLPAVRAEAGPSAWENSWPDGRVLDQVFCLLCLQLEKTQDLQAAHLLFCLSAAFPRNAAPTRLFPTFRATENGQRNVFPSARALGKTLFADEHNPAPARRCPAFSWDVIGASIGSLILRDSNVCASSLQGAPYNQDSGSIYWLYFACWPVFIYPVTSQTQSLRWC